MKKLLCFALTVCLAAALTLPASAALWEDIPEGHWASEELALCRELGLFETAENLFGLGKPMTRGAFLVAVCRLFGWETEQVAASPYQDVPADAWYAPSVAAAYRQGVVTEQSDKLRPEEPITREELAVTLVRALGYKSLSGLAGSLPSPFADVTTNTGYLTVAHDLGLMNGNNGKFLPNDPATREQCAAVLARLYRDLNKTPPSPAGFFPSAAELPQGLGTAVIRVGSLTEGKKASLAYSLDEAQSAAIRDAVHAAGARAVMYVTGANLGGGATVVLPQAVRERGYDGLCLSLSGRLDLSLLKTLKENLGDSLLCLCLPAPAWGEAPAFDYAALGAIADKLVVSVPCPERMIDNFPTAPPEPPEELYYTLRTLIPLTGAEKLSVVLTSTGGVWTGERQTGTLTGTAVEELKSESGVSAHYSERYDCPWLTYTQKRGTAEDIYVVWYLDQAAVSERVQMLRLFGVDQVFVSALGGVSEGFWAGLTGAEG